MDKTCGILAATLAFGLSSAVLAETRYIVVLKGTWYVGYGTDWDKTKTTPVPAGSFVVHHPNKIHWDGAKDEEVILQIMGVGPSATIRVDESGQPKK